MARKPNRARSSEQNLRICVIANAQAVHTRRWAEAYAARGHEVHVLSIRGAEMKAVQVHTLRVGPLNTRSRFWTLLSYLRLVLGARGRLKQLKPDVVHAHYSVTHGVVAALSGWRPIALTAWGSDVIWGRAGSMPFWYRWLNRLALARADLITSSSAFMLDHLRALAPLGAGIVQVPFGVDTRLFSPAPEPHSDGGAIRIGFVKSLHWKYGPETLIRSMPEVVRTVPKARLIMVGRGPLDERLRNLCAELGVTDHVKFVGFVPNEEVPHVMRDIDIFVNSSVVPESFGVAVLEASACGVPVVATHVGGVDEVCRKDQTGLMIPPGGAQPLADAIIHLALDPELRRSLGQAGRKFVVENYQWSDNVDAMLRQLRRLAVRARAEQPVLGETELGQPAE